MRDYAMPGTPMRRRSSVAVGVALLAIAVVAGFTVDSYNDRPPANRVQVKLRTQQLGEGIIDGTKVQLNGVDVGSVENIASLDQGRQLLTLDLDRNQIAGTSDNLDVAYAPENLFGISAVVLKPAGPGAPLHNGDVVDLTGSKASAVSDVTLSRLVRMLTQTSVQVLTPQLSQLINELSSDLQQFTPFLQSITVLSTTAAQTQRFEPSFLISQYGSFLGGLGNFSVSTLQLLDAILKIPIFEHDRPRFDATINMLSNQAFPGFAEIGDVSKTYFQGYTDMFTPTLAALAGTVRNPAQSDAQLSELLNRLDRMFTATPGGEAANVRVVLRGIPGLSVPLLGGTNAAQEGSR